MQRGKPLIRLSGKCVERAILFGENFERGFNRSHDFAVEDNLIANEPLQRAGNGFLDGLDDAVDESAGTRIHGSDGGDLRLGSVTRVYQRHEIRRAQTNGSRGIDWRAART